MWVFFVVEERNISCFLRIIAVTAVSIWSQIAFFKVLVWGVKGDQERNTWKDECVCGCYEEKKKQGQWISSGNLNLCLICVCWSPAGSSAQVCHVGDRGPTTWGITCCLLGCNGGKLESEARAGIETEMGYRPLIRYCWTRQPCWQTSWYIP